jgi:redox-sensitive bicupin YhaK (pirin superfamily)
VRVVAGKAAGVSGTMTDIAANPIYLDVELEPGASFSQPIPEGHTAIANGYQGKAEFGVDGEGRGEAVEVERRRRSPELYSIGNRVEPYREINVECS